MLFTNYDFALHSGDWYLDVCIILFTYRWYSVDKQSNSHISWIGDYEQSEHDTWLPDYAVGHVVATSGTDGDPVAYFPARVTSISVPRPIYRAFQNVLRENKHL